MQTGAMLGKGVNLLSQARPERQTSGRNRWRSGLL